MITTIFEAIVRSDANGRGAAGETLASDLLCRAGYHVTRNKRGEKRGDLRAINAETGEFWDIEVKTAVRRADGKYCFHLIQKGVDYRHAHYVLLIAILSGGKVATFLIPTRKLERQNVKSITISNVNAGKWSEYRVKGQVTL